jgi:hypothetical protein
VPDKYICPGLIQSFVLLRICSIFPNNPEDYQGPTSTGLFKWMPDENGMLRPVSRGKEKNLERNPSYWDRVFATKERDE